MSTHSSQEESGWFSKISLSSLLRGAIDVLLPARRHTTHGEAHDTRWSVSSRGRGDWCEWTPSRDGTGAPGRTHATRERRSTRATQRSAPCKPSRSHGTAGCSVASATPDSDARKRQRCCADDIAVTSTTRRAMPRAALAYGYAAPLKFGLRRVHISRARRAIKEARRHVSLDCTMLRADL